MPMSGPRPGLTPAHRLRGSNAASAYTVADLISCVGVPAHELTPKIMGAFTLLMAEIRRLRQENAQTECRLEQLRNAAIELASPAAPSAISNRETFNRLAAPLLAAARRGDREATLVHIVVEGIDDVNQRFGFGLGDSVLVRVAEILRAETRMSDLVGRLAGAHFAILLIDGTVEDATILAQRLARIISQQPFDSPEGPLLITIRHTVHPAATATMPIERLISAA